MKEGKAGRQGIIMNQRQTERTLGRKHAKWGDSDRICSCSAIELFKDGAK
jgi:hypothetical protein